MVVLMLLPWHCRFMEYCAQTASDNFVIDLTAVTAALKVGRRRIYDITNILEALDMVSRSTMNQYTWHGTGHLCRTIKKLRVSQSTICFV